MKISKLVLFIAALSFLKVLKTRESNSTNKRIPLERIIRQLSVKKLITGFVRAMRDFSCERRASDVCPLQRVTRLQRLCRTRVMSDVLVGKCPCVSGFIATLGVVASRDATKKKCGIYFPSPFRLHPSNPFIASMMIWEVITRTRVRLGWEISKRSLIEKLGASIHIDLHPLLPCSFPELFQSWILNPESIDQYRSRD